MKTSAILCSILAGTLGFGSVASAQDWNGGRRGDRDRAEQRQDRGDRADRQERRENRAERREDRHDRQDRREDRSFRQGYQAGNRHHQPYYVQQQPNYVYNQPTYRHAPRFQRGAYLPHEYRNQGYYVNDWRSHRGLYAPPHGHQWMQVGSDFVLVALATGIIASLLTQ